uniref:Col_cuticle_N domain-containing protein n=1 Tax=Angiostrongylus cantonensis TaxID=6313 RepID=A0A158PAT4_ANGCA
MYVYVRRTTISEKAVKNLYHLFTLRLGTVVDIDDHLSTIVTAHDETSSPNRVTVTPTGTSHTTTITSPLTSKLPKRSDEAYTDPQIGCREILPCGSTTSGAPRKDCIESQYFLKASENPKGHLVTASMKRPPMRNVIDTLTSGGVVIVAPVVVAIVSAIVVVAVNIGPILGNLGNHRDLLECSTQETTEGRSNVFECATEKETFKEQLGDIQLVKAKRGRNVQEILKRVPIRESKTSDEIGSDSVGIELVDVLSSKQEKTMGSGSYPYRDKFLVNNLMSSRQEQLMRTQYLVDECRNHLKIQL